MRRRTRVAAGVGAVAGGLLLLLLVGVLVLTQTDWGRERVRRFAVDWLNRQAVGEVAIGRVEGNLLSRIRLIDVSIVDDQGRPFVSADTIATRYSLRSLLRRRIVLTDMRFAQAAIVLDKPPGEDWNWVRIFPREPPPEDAEQRPGWGSWLEMRDIDLADVRVTVRTEWDTSDDLTPEEREETVRKVLAGEARENVVEVPGGYQNVMDFRELNARIPRVLVAHPDSSAVPIEIASFSGIVQPFRPPPALVEDLSGTFVLSDDSLHMRGVQAVLPGSRLAGGGVYALESGDLLLQVNGAPLAFDDFRWLYPPLPREGGGPLRLTVHRRTLNTRIVAEEMDLRVADATLAGRIDLMVGDTTRLSDTDVRFAAIPTDLIEQVVPDLEIPRDGRLTGELALEGTTEWMQVEGDIVFDDAAAGRSHVVAAGELGIRDQLRFREMRMRFSPLQAELVRVAIPEFPARGTVEGYANLTGATAGALQLDADLTLRDPRAGRSRVLARGGVDMSGEDVRVRNLALEMDPLRLDLLRDEIPELPAGGTLTGRMRFDGIPTRALTVDGTLALTDPATGVSRISATGALGYEQELRLQGLALRLHPLQLDLVRPWLPDLPAGATLAGPVRLTGAPAEALTVDGDLTLRDPATGESRIRATGGLAFADGLRFDQLDVSTDPLQLDLLSPWFDDLPAGAVVVADARLDGDPQSRVFVDGSATIRDPATGESRIHAAGGLAFAEELRFDQLHVRTDPLQLDLLSPWFDDLPAGAVVLGEARLDGAPQRMLFVDGEATIRDPATGESRVAATGGIRTADELRFDDLRLRFDPLRMNLVRGQFPDVPAGSTVRGSLAVSGAPAGFLRIDADLTMRDPASGTSEVVAVGGVNLAERSFDDLRLRLDRLQMALVRGFAPDLPLRGTVTGSATLNGSLEGRLAIAGDLEHREAGEYSRVVGDVDVAVGEDGRANVDVQLLPLSLNVAGRFVPGAGLHGSVSGSLQAQGSMDRIQLNTDLDVANGGSFEARGTLNLAGEQPAYDIRGTTRELNIAAISTRAPAVTSLTGPIAAEGRGFDPQTMRLSLEADLTGSRVDDLAADEVRLRVDVADGLARFDSTVVRLTHAEAVLDGSFGLRAGRHGVLRYRVVADSLGAFALAAPPASPEDTAEARPRSTAIPQIADETFAGSLLAQGVLAGNIEEFDAEGSAVAEDLVVQGNRLGSGRASYTVAGLGTPEARANFDAELEDVEVGGLTFESASATVSYQGGRFGTGQAVLAAARDADTELEADIEFALALDRSELRLNDLALRIDTVTWQSTRPGVIGWGNDGIELRQIDLASNVGGRVHLDGTVPADGNADLDIAIRDLEIGHIAAFVQPDAETAGRLTLDARVQGTRASPTISGDALLLGAFHDGRSLPDTRAIFSYGDRRLTAEADLLDEGRVLATAEADLPIDLALTSVEGSRLLEGQISIDVRADSLSLEALPSFTEQVQDVRGRVVGDFSVRGTFEDPELTGQVDVDVASLQIPALGLLLEEIGGSLRIEDGVMRVDSLVAWNGGTLAVAGEIRVPDLRSPVFDLAVRAEDAYVIDTDDARMRLDANVAITGPLTAIEVTGDVRTRSGVIYIPPLADFGGGEVVGLDDPGTFARVDTILRAERDALLERSPFLESVTADLAVFIDRDVWLRSTEANVEIYTPQETGPIHLRMNGSEDSFALEGTINTDRGEYEFMSRRFELTRGAATFLGDPEFNPFVQVAAEHELQIPGREAVAVRVILSGNLRELTVTLESDAQPPIPQTDLLSYLAFGRDAGALVQQQGSTLSGEGSIGGGVVGNVAGLATQQLASVALDAMVDNLERDAMRALRLDVFRITPADLPPELFTGSYLDVIRGTEVEAGRYVNPRWFVAGQARTASPIPGVLVEYRTPHGFQWTTSWAPRFLPGEPTLSEPEPHRARVFGSFLFREWRF